MTKRIETSYLFGCDAAGCTSKVTYNADGQPPGWTVLLVLFGGDRKDRHYCPNHCDGVLVDLGLKKQASAVHRECKCVGPMHVPSCPSVTP